MATHDAPMMTDRYSTQTSTSCIDETEPSIGAVATAIPPASPVNAGHAMLFFVAYVVAQVVGGIFVGLVAGLFATMNGYDLHDPTVLARVTQAITAPAAMAGVLFGGGILIGMSVHFASCSPRGSWLREIGWSWGTWTQLRVGCLSGAVLGLGYLSVVAFLLPPASDQPLGPQAQMAITPGVPRLTWILLVLAVAPPLEEFLFRGVLFTGLSRSWGVRAASVVVTALFVLVHVPETIHYPPATLAVAVVGISALVIRIRAHAIGPAVGLHFAYNLVITLGVLVLTESSLPRLMSP